LGGERERDRQQKAESRKQKAESRNCSREIALYPEAVPAFCCLLPAVFFPLSL
jgi:hypothetical protein